MLCSLFQTCNCGSNFGDFRLKQLQRLPLSLPRTMIHKQLCYELQYVCRCHWSHSPSRHVDLLRPLRCWETIRILLNGHFNTKADVLYLVFLCQMAQAVNLPTTMSLLLSYCRFTQHCTARYGIYFNRWSAGIVRYPPWQAQKGKDWIYYF